MTIEEVNGIDFALGLKLKIIVNRLQELRTEEKAKERTIKNVLDAEKAYYRALYKNYSRSEIEALDRACKEMKNKARLSEVSYRNSMVSILNQCLHVFMVELSATSDMQKNFAEKILDLLSTFDDSPRTFSTLGFNFDVEKDDYIFLTILILLETA
jgi:triphosphoribosyl-dephospho-CoA synthetase